MPRTQVDGVGISYTREGSGDPVLLVMGSSASGQVWTTHQTPALVAAGLQCVTFDHRGVPPSDVPPGRYSLADLVGDTRGLIEALGLGPCHLVGTSLGSLVVQELAIAHPELVRSAVLLATKARDDTVRRALDEAERAWLESGVKLPPAYEAAVNALQMLSPATLDDDREAQTWLELFEVSAELGSRAEGQSWARLEGDRRDALRSVSAPCRVIAYADDLITPPRLGREVSEAIPGCDLVEIADCGHYGFLERPAETNKAILEFLDGVRS